MEEETKRDEKKQGNQTNEEDNKMKDRIIDAKLILNKKTTKKYPEKTKCSLDHTTAEKLSFGILYFICRLLNLVGHDKQYSFQPKVSNPAWLSSLLFKVI
jgi:hypothetical protein